MRKLSGLLACLLSAGCASMPAMLPTGLKVKVGEPFVIAQSAPGRTDWGTYSHPNVFQYVSGIRVGFLPAGEGSADRTLEPAYSTDGGETWRYGWAGMVEAFQWKGDFEGGLQILTRDGRELAFNLYESQRWHSPDGRNWIGPEPVAISLDLDPQVIINREYWPASPKGAEGPDGHLYSVWYAHMPLDGSRALPANMSAHEFLFLLKSEDGGSTWGQIEVANRFDTPWGNEGPNEAAVVVADDGTVVILARTGAYGSIDAVDSDPMLLARSRDGGATWELRNSGRRGVYPQLLRLANGVLACSYGRPGNHLMFSTTHGRSWGNEIVLSPPGVLTTGYTGLVEVEPGRLLVVYDIMKTTVQKFWLWDPPQPANFIMGVFVDVEGPGPSRAPVAE